MQQVILAAGKGSRLKSTATNKCLVELCNKKLIDYNLDLGIEIKASKMIVVVGYNKEHIINYLGKVYKGIPIEYVVQEPQCGIAHGIMMASKHITESFFMCLSDEVLINPNVRGFKSFFEMYEADCVCGVVNDTISNIKKAYTIDLDSNNKIYQISEKPKSVFNGLRGTGYCMMTKQMLNCLKELKVNPIRNEYEMGDWINIALKNKYNCYAFELADAAYNINEQSDLINAEKHIIIERNS